MVHNTRGNICKEERLMAIFGILLLVALYGLGDKMNRMDKEGK